MSQVTRDVRPALRVQSLVKRFSEESLAVDGISFDAAEGEFIVLLGPSGCGKTTTLRCVAGFERPDAGRIVVGDDVVEEPQSGRFVPPQRRNVGMVFQSYAIWPHMTVAQNVAFPLRVRRMKRAEIASRVERVLDLVGLARFGERSASALSGGQQQRVALARALVYDPRLLLLDEPLSNLDAELRTRLRFELKNIQRESGVTTVYVTHDQSEAVVLADRVAVIKDGRIEQLSSAADMYNRPATLFVAAFTGTENVIRGVLAESREAIGVARAAGELELRAHLARPVASGEQIGVAFRAENVALSREPAGDAVNAWDATVKEAVFLGLQTRYTVDVGGQSLVAVRAGSLQEFHPGDAVVARLAPELATILALEGDGDGPAEPVGPLLSDAGTPSASSAAATAGTYTGQGGTS